ncbi:hypothetical protein [Pelagibacterium limicola]|uniref:hypothetical protein n=1 Tax=Pelagibacterium limicola TaxID=2791022 RepID=UPI0018AFDAAC|nr:hypothetical protein [Pelagibacterium limicola]
MSVNETVTAAFKGWSRILGGHSDWRSFFTFDAQALNLGFVLYFAAATLSVIALVMRVGMPASQTMITLIAGHAMPVLALVISASFARRALALPNPVTEFYVPGLFLLALMNFAGAVTILIGVPLWGAILALTAVFFHKLGRAAGLAFGPALAFALFNFVAGLPYSLYMMGGMFAVSA